MRSALLTLLLTTNLFAAEVRVFAAASLTDAMREAATLYETSSPDRIVFNFGGSHILARQIDEGAPADLFASADEARMDALQRGGRIVPSTRVSLLSNRLVVVVPSGAKPMTPNDLSRVATLALANPHSVPAGVYAESWLRAIGVWEKVRRRVVATDNVRAALAAVEAGNADAAIVFRTDALRSRAARIAFTVDGQSRPKISYPFAVVREAENRRGAERFLRFLGTKPALDVFRRHGFEILRKP